MPEREPRQVTGILSKVPDGWYTVAKAAELVGRHPDRLRDWRRRGLVIPSGWMPRGKLAKVYLYNDEDIAEIRNMLERAEPGMPLEGEL